MGKREERGFRRGGVRAVRPRSRGAEGAPCEVTIFSREGGARRGVFSPPAHEGRRRRTATAQRVRVTRARPPFFDFFLHCFTLWT